MRPYGKETQMGYDKPAAEDMKRKSAARRRGKKEAEQQLREYEDEKE